MRTLLLIFLVTLFSCSNTKTENTTIQQSGDLDSTSSFTAIDAKFPLKLDKLNLDDKKNIVHLNDYIVSEIEKTIKQYATDIQFDDSTNTYKDIYINTIRLQDTAQTIYLVLLKQFTTGEINSKVLFYSNKKKQFANNSFDFNLHASYELDNGKLKSTNLKTVLKITAPETELVDFNKDGRPDFKFTRLFHNGTFNSLHTTVLTVNNPKIDILNFNEKALGEWGEKE